jgi:hypothetical protein
MQGQAVHRMCCLPETLNLHQDRLEKLVPRVARVQMVHRITGVDKTRLAQVFFKNNINAVYVDTRLTVKGVLKGLLQKGDS